MVKVKVKKNMDKKKLWVQINPLIATYVTGRTLVRRLLPAILSIIMLVPTVAGEISQTHVQALASANTAVLTYKNNTFLTGLNDHEAILNTGNVNPSQFGKRMTYPVDGQLYAQPLYMPNLSINGSVHNVVFVATEHDSVYAFDADQTSSVLPLWHTSFLSPTVTTVSVADVATCETVGPEYGITSTPVVDSKTKTLYVVANTKENGTIIYRLHKLDLTTGAEKPGSPVGINATVRGSGVDNIGGFVTFNSQQELQRAALLLLKGVVYIAFASHCDNGPYHGWIMGYNATTLRQMAVYNDTPNGSDAGIWQSGAALAADREGNIYVNTGNGTFDLNNGGEDAGNTILKFSTSGGALILTDYFTPFNQECLNFIDFDLGSGGVLLLPSANELITAGKEGRIYVVNRAKMGKYTQIAQPCANQDLTNVDNVLQELPPDTIAGSGLFSTPAYWNSTDGQFVYFIGYSDHLKAFRLTNGRLSTSPTSQSSEVFNLGGNPTVSSNGRRKGTGIVWAIDSSSTLRAYDATNVATELYNSDENPGRDALGPGNFVKFSVPTVVNGQVFVGTKSGLIIYSLLG